MHGDDGNLVELRVSAVDLVHVVDPFVHATASTDLTYFRLHGISGSRHVYTPAELRTLAARVPAGGDAYVMFNNIPRVGDAQRSASSWARPRRPGNRGA